MSSNKPTKTNADKVLRFVQVAAVVQEREREGKPNNPQDVPHSTFDLARNVLGPLTHKWVVSG